MTGGEDLEILEAEVRYDRERIALLRARMYRSGGGPNARLEELERKLEHAERRLQDARQRPARTE